MKRACATNAHREKPKRSQVDMVWGQKSLSNEFRVVKKKKNLDQGAKKLVELIKNCIESIWV